MIITLINRPPFIVEFALSVGPSLTQEDHLAGVEGYEAVEGHHGLSARSARRTQHPLRPGCEIEFRGQFSVEHIFSLSYLEKVSRIIRGITSALKT